MIIADSTSKVSLDNHLVLTCQCSVDEGVVGTFSVKVSSKTCDCRIMPSLLFKASMWNSYLFESNLERREMKKTEYTC